MEKEKIMKNQGVLRKSEGFTLIEILIVIAILGLLAAIAIPQLSIYRMKSYNTAALSDIKNAAIAQEAYFVENQRYSQSVASLTTPPYNFYLSAGVTVSVVAATQTNYFMTAHHSSGNIVYTLRGPGGKVEP